MPSDRATQTDDESVLEPDESADAFGALAAPIRVEILRALWNTPGREATFSQLRDAVGVADSGRFNYHLGQLTDDFLLKTDDGYRPTVAGASVIGSLYAGAYDRGDAIETVPVAEPCSFCGGDRTFSYDDEEAVVTCDGCDVVTNARVPAGVFADADPGEYPVLLRRYLRSKFRQLDDGFCVHCEGRIEANLWVGDDGHPTLAPLPTANYDCHRCGSAYATDLGTALTSRPPVVGFFNDHAVDVRTAPLARFRATTAEAAETRSEDPPEACVRYEAGDEGLELVVDGSLDVISVERTTLD